MRVVKVLMALLLGVSLLAGCWDQQEITEIAPITGLGLDSGDRPGTIKVSVQMSPPSPSTPSGGAGGVGQSTLRVVTIEASTMLEAFTLLFSHARREPFLRHLGFIVFGEELAKAGIGGTIGGMQGLVTIRGSVPVLVARGTAENILKARSGTGRNPGQDVLDLLSTLRAAPLGATVQLHDVINTLTGLGRELALPIIELTRLRLQAGDEAPADGTDSQGNRLQEVIITRTALFDRDRWVAELDPYMTQVYILLNGTVSTGVKSIAHPTDPHGVMAVQIEHFIPQFKPQVGQNGEVILDLSIKISARLIEARGSYDIRLHGFDPIAQILSKEFTSQALELLSTLQSLGIDSLGIGDMIYRKNPAAWSRLEPNWDETFSRMPVRVRIEAKLTGTSLIVRLFDVKRRR